MLIVIREFKDSADKGRIYRVGDMYPVPGGKPTKTRVKALLTGNNRCGKVYLREIEPDTGENEPDPGENQAEN